MQHRMNNVNYCAIMSLKSLSHALTFTVIFLSVIISASWGYPSSVRDDLKLIRRSVKYFPNSDLEDEGFDVFTLSKKANKLVFQCDSKMFVHELAKDMGNKGDGKVVILRKTEGQDELPIEEKKTYVVLKQEISDPNKYTIHKAFVRRLFGRKTVEWGFYEVNPDADPSEAALNFYVAMSPTFYVSQEAVDEESGLNETDDDEEEGESDEKDSDSDEEDEHNSGEEDDDKKENVSEEDSESSSEESDENESSEKAITNILQKPATESNNSTKPELTASEKRSDEGCAKCECNCKNETVLIGRKKRDVAQGQNNTHAYCTQCCNCNAIKVDSMDIGSHINNNFTTNATTNVSGRSFRKARNKTGNDGKIISLSKTNHTNDRVPYSLELPEPLGPFYNELIAQSVMSFELYSIEARKNLKNQPQDVQGTFKDFYIVKNDTFEFESRHWAFTGVMGCEFVADAIKENETMITEKDYETSSESNEEEHKKKTKGEGESEENDEEETEEEAMVDFYLKIIQGQCRPALKESMMDLFKQKHVYLKSRKSLNMKVIGLRLQSNFRAARYLSKCDFNTFISAIYLSEFSNAFAQRQVHIDHDQEDAGAVSPAGNKISKTVRTLVVFVEKVLKLLKHTQFQRHAVKITMSLVKTLAIFKDRAQKQGFVLNQYCKDRCKADRPIAEEDLQVTTALIDYVIYGVSEVIRRSLGFNKFYLKYKDVLGYI